MYELRFSPYAFREMAFQALPLRPYPITSILYLAYNFL